MVNFLHRFAQNHSERGEILDHFSDLRCGRCHSFWIFSFPRVGWLGFGQAAEQRCLLARQLRDLAGRRGEEL
jgi:hypothetical protein